MDKIKPEAFLLYCENVLVCVLSSKYDAFIEMLEYIDEDNPSNSQLDEITEFTIYQVGIGDCINISPKHEEESLIFSTNDYLEDDGLKRIKIGNYNDIMSYIRDYKLNEILT